MRAVSQNYTTLRSQSGSYYEVQIVQGNHTYTASDICSIAIHPALYDESGLSVGNAYSASCEIQLIEQSANWPRMAAFTVRVRLSSADGATKSGWLKMGTFYTDERSEDTYGNLSIVGYDGMLMTEQYWTDKIPEQQLPAEWPITSRAWANMIQNAGLIQIDSGTVLNNTVALIGLNTASTIRDVLKTIAAAHGGNWVITPDGNLKLVYFSLQTVSSNDPRYLGMNVQHLETSPALTGVSGVHLEAEDGTAADAGNDTGYVLNGVCEFASSTGVANLCLTNVQNYVYKPFEASTAILDPAVEVGDTVVISGDSYQVIAIDWNISTWPTANIKAPYDAEVDHEYQIVSPEAKAYRKTIAKTDDKLKNYPTTTEMTTAISQSAQGISLNVSTTYVTKTDYNQTVQNLQDQISGSITQYSGDPVPTLNNYPAVDWQTPADRSQHVGALYLVTAGDTKGQYYRFEQSGNNFGWVIVEDSALSQALANAAAAQEAAEAAQEAADAAQQAADAAQGTADQAAADAEAKSAAAEAAAKTAAAADATAKANAALQAAKDYADAQLNDFITGDYADDLDAVRGQLDQKVETWYQANDPASGWQQNEKAKHEGDLWYRTSDNTTWRYVSYTVASGMTWDPTTGQFIATDFTTEYEWRQQNVPTAVFDKIDGKAAIFTSQPVPPYRAKDLWVEGPTGDIYRCINGRASGSFNQTDWELASKYTDDSALTQFVNSVYTPAMQSIGAELDGKIDTYFYSYAPTLSNAPASGWTTATIKDEHVDDIFYDTSKGYAYRFTKSGSTYSWTRIKDADITAAMTAASQAQDTADGKRRVFVTQPAKADAYDVGDLWVNATYGTYSNDLLKCKTAKASGAAFNIAHWEKATKYTDDSGLSEFLNGTYATDLSAIRGQIDQKIETWFQSANPASAWSTPELKAEHVGDLWYNTTDGVNTTSRWNGSQWVQQNAPKAVFDQIDGKRQVFTSQPTTAQAYAVGDLWVNATYETTYSNDLLRCKTKKAAGAAFSITHWELASKYTDDTAVNEMAIGGRNLVKKTAEEKDKTVTSASAASYTGYYYFSDYGQALLTGNTTDKITVSFDYEVQNAVPASTTAVSVYPQINTVKGSAPSISVAENETGHYEKTFKLNSDQSTYANSYRIRFRIMNADVGAYLKVSNVKVEKGSKATTWTAAPEDIQKDLDDFKTTVESQFDVASGEISARVTRTGNNQTKSFSWSLTEEAHVWKKKVNGVETEVLRIDWTGLHVNGDGTFTGTVSAATITGGTINIGNGNFIVTSTGQLTAKSGTFEGSVYAGSILSGSSGGNNYGYLPGSGVSASGNFSSAYLSSGLNDGPLAYANKFNSACQQNTGTFPPYFTAGSISADSSVYSPSYQYTAPGGSDTDIELVGHYHTISVSNGKVTIGAPANPNQAPSFNINDLVSSITPVFGA